MDSVEFFRPLLGLTTPWSVEQVELDMAMSVECSFPARQAHPVRLCFVNLAKWRPALNLHSIDAISSFAGYL
jgi:hypothetical protein